MKKFGLFLGRVLTGAVLTFLVLFVIAKAGNGSTLDGATNFEQVGDVVDETSVKVFQVIADNAALVKGQKVDDWKFDWYFGAVYLLRNDDSEYYYDDEIVKRPSGKQFRQTGIYRYNTQTGYKTVPIIELKHRLPTSLPHLNPTEEIINDALATAWRISMDITFKEPAWFRIVENCGEYDTAIFYDNEYNHANGEYL